MGVLTVWWAFIFVISILIFRFVVNIPELPGFMGIVSTAVLKVLLSALLVGVWMSVAIQLRNFYVKRKLGLQK